MNAATLLGSIKTEWRIKCSHVGCHTLAEYALKYPDSPLMYLCCVHIAQHSGYQPNDVPIRNLLTYQLLTRPRRDEYTSWLPMDLRIIVGKMLGITQVRQKNVDRSNCIFCQSNASCELTMMKGPHYGQFALCEKDRLRFKHYL